MMVSRDEINQIWEKKLQNNHSPWDMPQGSPYLKNFFQYLVKGNISGKRILVPLCGATVDMAWFFKQGLTVVGIELFETPCKLFFERLSLSYEVEEKNNVKVYSHDDRLKICQCDFFSTNCDLLGGCFDYWFDVGGLEATVPEEQQKYINQLTSLLKPVGRVLMECFEYDMSLRRQPPHSIPTETLKVYLSDKYIIEELSRKTEDELPEEYTARIGCNCVHVLYLLTRKLTNV